MFMCALFQFHPLSISQENFTASFWNGEFFFSVHCFFLLPVSHILDKKYKTVVKYKHGETIDDSLRRGWIVWAKRVICMGKEDGTGTICTRKYNLRKMESIRYRKYESFIIEKCTNRIQPPLQRKKITICEGFIECHSIRNMHAFSKRGNFFIPFLCPTYMQFWVVLPVFLMQTANKHSCSYTQTFTFTNTNTHQDTHVI